MGVSPNDANSRHAPERVNIVEGRRVTIPAAAREVVWWFKEVGPKAPLVYELQARGCVRMRAGHTLLRAMETAREVGDHAAATRLTALFLESTWQTETRVTLPQQVTDRLFGVGILPESLMVWGTPDAIELWSDEYWMSLLDHIAQTDAKFASEKS